VSQPRQEPLRALAFDWGGVFTVGTFDGRAVEALAALLERPEDEVARAYYPLMERFEIGAFDLPGFHRRLNAHLGADVEEAAFRETFLGAPRERRAMFELLAGIPAAYTVGMLSNNVPELCDLVRSDARMARIERFVFSNEIGVRKPDARAFEALTEALGVPAAETVFVDDNATNVSACRALGFRGLLFDAPAHFAVRWRALPADLAQLATGAAWSA
jgi:putative hydrolase of the HAD superfamily